MSAGNDLGMFLGLRFESNADHQHLATRALRKVDNINTAGDRRAMKKRKVDDDTPVCAEPLEQRTLCPFATAVFRVGLVRRATTMSA